MLAVRYEGLRETLQALRVIEHGLYLALLDGLNNSGRIVLDEARQRFVAWGNGDPNGSAASAAGFQKGGEGLRVFVRPNTSTMAVLSVGQSLLRRGDIKRRRSNFGGLMMTKGLLPARTAKTPAVLAAIDGSVAALLRANGF